MSMGNKRKKGKEEKRAEMKYGLLAEKLSEAENGIAETAEAIGVTEQELVRKLSGELPLYAFEVFEICRLKNIVSLKDKLSFFYPERPKSGTKRKEGSGNT